MALKGTTAEERTYNYLLEKIGNAYGTAAVMGNLKAESGIIFNRVEVLCLKRLKENGAGEYTDKSYTEAVDSGKIGRTDFLNPLKNKQYGYGVAQWTSPNRKAGLYDLVKSRSVSIADEQAQLDWLISELTASYKTVLATLKSATSVKEASDIFLTKFEQPADCGDQVKRLRASYGQTIYDKYNNSGTSSSGSTQTTAAKGGTTMTAAKAQEYVKKLLKHYPFTYCPTLAGMTTNATPHKGDVVLFYRNGTYAHTGYVYKVSGSTYYTIEGNTSGASGVIANGGGVCKKSYKTSEYPGTKFFRPDYSVLVTAGIFASTDAAIAAIISAAEAEVGYLEKKSNSNLYDKTANAGSNNYTKYWADLYPAFQGQAWCAIFVTWIIYTAIMNGKSTSAISSGSAQTGTSTSASSGKYVESGTTSPSQKVLYKMTCTANGVRVRTSPSAKDTSNISKYLQSINKGQVVEYCDQITANGNTWDFVKIPCSKHSSGYIYDYVCADYLKKS